jgi:uncharacterized protein (TIGR03118 family)
MYTQMLTRVFAVTAIIALARVHTASAATVYEQTNLTSDISGLAANLDPNLKNPWGMSFSPTSPFWVSNQTTNTSTLYNATGVPQSLDVTTPSGPTGQVANTTMDFQVGPGEPARFIFASLSGTVSGWNPAVEPTSAAVRFTAADGAVYTGLAQGAVGGNNHLYAADSRNGKIDVLDGSFQKVSLAGSFTDPSVPVGFVPYNVQNVGDKLYVTYAMADMAGGFVGVFDLSGNLLQHISDSHLNEPWGVTIAPATFGSFGNALLIGNNGDGMINGFDPSTGVFLGTISSASGPIVNEGLWAVDFRAPGSGFDANALYFAAGINDETNGLFGTITPAAVPEPATAWTGALTLAGLGLARWVRSRKITN